MIACTFFGHGDAGEEIKGKIEETIVHLIENNGVDMFYVGTQGNFDKMVYSILKKLNRQCNIKYQVVLPCVPINDKYKNYLNTVVPDGIEKVPPRFGIEYRNKWMVKKSTYVLTYVHRSFGGAAKFKNYSEKYNKIVINI